MLSMSNLQTLHRHGHGIEERQKEFMRVEKMVSDSYDFEDRSCTTGPYFSLSAFATAPKSEDAVKNTSSH
jgi:hypothetical protein